ncbi:Gamma-aminobutyric acid receptor subunit beta-like [Nymphon striatum]|nr:Gamma-aminobutyric acid receptor subunit beta-like [Nymphon striatum]
MHRIYDVSDTSHGTRDNISDPLGAMSVEISVNNGQVSNTIRYESGWRDFERIELLERTVFGEIKQCSSSSAHIGPLLSKGLPSRSPVLSIGSTFNPIPVKLSYIITHLLFGLPRRPLYVGMALKVASFDSISEVNMDYTITLNLQQYWTDGRLAFSNESSELTLSGDFAEKIWVPDTFFANDKNSFLHDVTEKNKMVKLSSDGSIAYSMRFTTTLACMMDLHNYPLDLQECTVEIESYGYTVNDVVMYWITVPIDGVKEIKLPQFSIVNHNTKDRSEVLATASIRKFISDNNIIVIAGERDLYRGKELCFRHYQRLSLIFVLKRNIGYFIFQTYLPSILIVMLSWVSFWINHEATSARVALGITTVLTMTTISTGVRSSLPRISYVKAIDIYLVMCFVFVFAALLEYAAVNYTYWGARAKKKVKKLRESNNSKAADGVCSASDDVIELQEVRMSPIPGIRNRNKSFSPPGGSDIDSKPRLRMANNPPRFSHTTGSRGLMVNQNRRGRNLQGQKKKKVLQSIRRGASAIKNSMPKIKDINVIDKYSRVVFPISFIIFNAVYWCYYVIGVKIMMGQI